MITIKDKLKQIAEVMAIDNDHYICEELAEELRAEWTDDDIEYAWFCLFDSDGPGYVAF